MSDSEAKLLPSGVSKRARRNITGEEAMSAFTKASNLVKEGRFDEARAMKDELLKSDWNVIEKKIAEAEGLHT
jgi:pentatricopeptide repeat protein